MDFTKSSLWKDVQAITSKGRFSRKKISAVFHIAGVDYPAFRVDSIDIERDYRNNFGDVLMMQALIPKGTYAVRFYPNMDNIECTLTFMPSGQDGERQGYTTPPSIERFKVILVNPSTDAIDLNADREISEQAMNITGMATAQFQLFNKALYQLRGIGLGGIYRDCKADDVLKSLLTHHSLALKNIDSEDMPIGVEMVEATATATRKHVNIPQSIRLTQLAEYLQKECNGIYPAGVACYYQGRYWYVFPPFDTSRFNKTKRMLTVINVPAGVLPSTERSYMQDGNNIRIAATGKSKLTNQSDKVLTDAGSGVRFGNAEGMFDGFVDVENNVALASRGKNVTEYRSVDRPDGNYLAPVSSSKITSNNLEEMSRMAARDGVPFTLTWEHAVHDVLEPGMASRIYYLDNGLARYVDAVLLHAHYFHYTTEGAAATMHLCEATLTFFITRKQPIHD